MATGLLGADGGGFDLDGAPMQDRTTTRTTTIGQVFCSRIVEQGQTRAIWSNSNRLSRQSEEILIWRKGFGFLIIGCSRAPSGRCTWPSGSVLRDLIALYLEKVSGNVLTRRTRMRPVSSTHVRERSYPTELKSSLPAGPPRCLAPGKS
jgi:hypothetical protein